jgi:hydroxyethylthiazole kinase
VPLIDPGTALSHLRGIAPLVHNMTNTVAANLTANALLAVGALPAMVGAVEEVEEFVRLAQSLVVNIGTLDAQQLAAMRLATATAAAASAGRPWVLDPVAAGATAFRSAAAQELLAARPTVLRGNASEILAMAGAAGTAVRGMDSSHGSEAARDAASFLARRFGTTVAVTGRIDYVTDGETMIGVGNGHPMLTRVTGTGCTATALIGAFLGAGFPALEACACGLAVLGLAGEAAAQVMQGPGSFQVALLDALHAMDDTSLKAGARLI